MADIVMSPCPMSVNGPKLNLGNILLRESIGQGRTSKVENSKDFQA